MGKYFKLKKKFINPDELKENSFGIEPELTIRLAKKKKKCLFIEQKIK